MAKRKQRRMKDLIADAQFRVKAQLPEDEHDYTAPWVYAIAIGVGMEEADRRALDAATDTPTGAE